jgi:phosphate transport system permease protein
MGRVVRRSLDVLASVPSVVFGLFGNAVFCQALGMGFSLLSGGLTLACMVLPFFIRTAEEGLRAVPKDYRLAAASLGLSHTGTLAHILIPAAMPGLLAGFILSVSRSLAETAALIFTSGYVDRMPSSLLESGRTLSVHIYDLSMNVSGGDGMAYSSALVLMIILIVLNRIAMWLSRKWSTQRVVAS